MLSFLHNLAGVKTDQAAQGALEALVRWDPQAATEAELRTMEQHLDELGLQVAQARAAHDRERREAEAIQQLSAQRMAAAEQLERHLTSEADPQRKAGLEKSLATLVGMLEQMAPEVDRERQDAEDAQDFLETLERTYTEAGQKLRAARSELARAQRDMGRAAQQREVAQRQAEAARQAAGLSRSTSGLSVALKAMQESAARDLAAAEAAGTKAKLLQPSRPEQDDPNIAAAMASASGAVPAPSGLSDCLAELRQRQLAGPSR
jgi:chromosome segregation ATPase